MTSNRSFCRIKIWFPSALINFIAQMFWALTFSAKAQPPAEPSPGYLLR
jgi:hypothetical protein